MGEVLRQCALRVLGLGSLWQQLAAMATRIKRLEQDVVVLQRSGAKHTIPASPPPPAEAERPNPFYVGLVRAHGLPRRPPDGGER